VTPPFRRVLVANRGEIAIRIIRTCREMGIESVAVYSDADRDAPHVRAADHGEWIGGTAPAESYLSATAILAAAQRSGAEAIHPGYGFLSESAAFARAVVDAGLVWIGPPAATMEGLGNKIAARQVATDAGVAVAPGMHLDGTFDSAAAELSFPLLVKAAAGGGGRGMRRVDSRDELDAAVADARREADTAFGDGSVYVERLITVARHVEVQLLGDRHGGLAVLGDRDCSIQRRHQKLVEEAPAPGLSGEIHAGLADDARRIARSVEFHGAATAEFLVDEAGDHWFLEMNTRLQVEHGITELVTGLDLVAWQLRIAAGDALPADLLDPELRGHAIEVRVYAEDPWNGFGPTAGRIGAWQMPDGPGVRVDAGVKAGYELPTAYDPLLAKIMVHATDRDAAVARLRRALDETGIGGMATTLGFHRWLVDQPAFLGGGYDTDFVSDAWAGGPPLADDEAALVAAVVAAARLDPERRSPRPPTPGNDPPSGMPIGGERPWARAARTEAVEP
jgi:acetyl/propionyl-CoA carboxylase alpha subunit